MVDILGLDDGEGLFFAVSSDVSELLFPPTIYYGGKATPQDAEEVQTTFGP